MAKLSLISLHLKGWGTEIPYPSVFDLGVDALVMLLENVTQTNTMKGVLENIVEWGVNMQMPLFFLLLGDLIIAHNVKVIICACGQTLG